MNDKTLLELAAKAAGFIVGLGVVNADDDFIGIYVQHDRRIKHVLWNPLTNDGDALRLAVRLGFRIDIEYQYDGEQGYTWIEQGEITEYHVGDPYAATRRAIVRAAAAIAEQGEKE